MINLDHEDDKVGYKRELHYRTGNKVERKLKPQKVYTFPMSSGSFELTIGRSSSNKLYIDEDRKLSREHCKIETKDGKIYTFYDLGSSRGSKINHLPITKQVLKQNDTIKIGSTKLKFKIVR